VELAFGILVIAAAAIAVTTLAERLRVSAPLLLILVGMVASFVPFIHEPELEPELVLFGLLPPLLYSAALRTSVLDFKANRRSIGLLSIGLVVFTALGVGLVGWLLLPIPFPVAFALGAVVAPPDAVAATAIARRVGLPRRLVTILEGESLVNDATAITCLRVAIVAMSGTVTVVGVSISFLVAALGGILVGVAVAFLTLLVRRHLREPVVDTAISIMAPFAAYVPAEAISLNGSHGSGVIAVVVAGLIVGTKSPAIQSGRSRVSERVNWATITFLLENAVFLLIGLQARRIFTGVQEGELSGVRVAVFCLAILATVIGLRLVWVFASRLLLFRRDRDRGPELPPWSHVFVIGWAGLRGVVTLATVFLIPETAPHREVLELTALVVVAGTLLIQGGTLPWIVRRLGLRGPDPRSDALQAATVLESATRVALAKLDEVIGPDSADQTVASVRQRILDRPLAMWEKLGARDQETPAEEYRRLRLLTLQAEREEVLRIRRAGTTEADVIEQVLTALDIEESMLDVATEYAEELDEPVTTPASAEGPCEHLAAAPAAVDAGDVSTCADCLREGLTPVHLRVCLRCANVGCCDSSVGRHAERHFRESGHLVMRSFEAGEDWRWCYADERIG
jgi:CPA1 family monovalent cation:H+ antiporter